jgi:AraC-like DNA-binding protein
VSTLDEGQWMLLKDAAAVLGISERTARRRIKGTELQGRLVASQTPELLAALAQLERQQQTIMELSGRLGLLQAEL